MNEEDLKKARRSTRLSICLPMVISGLDAQGERFRENVHTLIVNKHGGKIATARRLTLGTEIVIENPGLGITAKAQVVWFGEKQPPRALHHAGLQLAEAQDIWGIAFPPNDWSTGPDASPPSPAADSVNSAPGTAADEKAPAPDDPIATLLPQPAGERDWAEWADAHERELQDRLRQLTESLAREFESALRDRVAAATAEAFNELKRDADVLADSLAVSRADLEQLQANIQELKTNVQDLQRGLPPLPDARRQLTALAHSIIVGMNDAAESGIKQYRALLEKANLESAGRRPSSTDGEPAGPPRSRPES